MDPFLLRWYANTVTGEMAARGDLQGIKWIAEKYLPDEFLTESVAQASSNGHISILKWLWENHHEMTYWGGIELSGAIKNNQYEAVEWLRTHIDLRFECAQHVIEYAAMFGNLEIVEWLFNMFDVEIVTALNSAANSHHWGIMRWLISNGKRSDLNAARNDENIYTTPAQHGNLDMVKFLFDRGIMISSESSDEELATLHQAAVAAVKPVRKIKKVKKPATEASTDVTADVTGKKRPVDDSTDVVDAEEAQKLKREARKKRKAEEKLAREAAKKKQQQEQLANERATKGRAYTLSMAIPGSILDNAQTKELKTYLAGQVARAAVIFQVDEIVVFDDQLGSN
ncbi:Hypothetical protein PHPALM_2292, partial [Phytophthora palmivora]